MVWAPTQDGGFFALKTELYLPEMPNDMRQQGSFEHVPAIVGISAQDGADVASMYFKHIVAGLCIYLQFSGILSLKIIWIHFVPIQKNVVLLR